MPANVEGETTTQDGASSEAAAGLQHGGRAKRPRKCQVCGGTFQSGTALHAHLPACRESHGLQPLGLARRKRARSSDESVEESAARAASTAEGEADDSSTRSAAEADEGDDEVSSEVSHHGSPPRDWFSAQPAGLLQVQLAASTAKAHTAALERPSVVEAVVQASFLEIFQYGGDTFMHDCARHGLNPVTMLLEQIAYPVNNGFEITNEHARLLTRAQHIVGRLASANVDIELQFEEADSPRWDVIRRTFRELGPEVAARDGIQLDGLDGQGYMQTRDIADRQTQLHYSQLRMAWSRLAELKHDCHVLGIDFSALNELAPKKNGDGDFY